MHKDMRQDIQLGYAGIGRIQYPYWCSGMDNKIRTCKSFEHCEGVGFFAGTPDLRAKEMQAGHHSSAFRLLRLS
jgi:hypothetical protein